MQTPSRSAPASIAPVAALLIVALALRPQIAAIGPLADSIIADLGASHAFVGLLTAIPVLCMGVFAVVGPSLAARVGVRAGITLSVAVLLAFAAARSLVPGSELLLLMTFGVGVGTGVIGPILPMFVHGRLPGLAVAGTAAYAAGTILGAAAASGIVVPLERAAGGWREALLVLTALSGVSLLAWVLLVRGLAGPAPAVSAPAASEPAATTTRRIPWRRPIAWAIGILFGLQSWLYYGTTAWLANVYVERGWDAAGAAGLLTLFNGASLGAIVIVPWLSHRGASRRSLLVASSVLITVGIAGVMLVPDPAIAWTILAGLGLGITFTLLLTLPVDISRDQRESGGAAALMLLVGYLLASVAPFALGAVRDATGDFEASLAVLVVIGVVMAAGSWGLSPARLRQRPAREQV